MKNLLSLAVLMMGFAPALAFAQEEPTFVVAYDFQLSTQPTANAYECLSGVEAGIFELKGQTLMILRNFVQGACAHQAGNVVQYPGHPPRSYQHDSNWRVYSVGFDGQDSCGVHHYSGSGTYHEEPVFFSLRDFREYSRNCSPSGVRAQYVLTEHHSAGYNTVYFFMGYSPSNR